MNPNGTRLTTVRSDANVVLNRRRPSDLTLYKITDMLTDDHEVCPDCDYHYRPCQTDDSQPFRSALHSREYLTAGGLRTRRLTPTQTV